MGFAGMLGAIKGFLGVSDGGIGSEGLTGAAKALEVFDPIVSESSGGVFDMHRFLRVMVKSSLPSQEVQVQGIDQMGSMIRENTKIAVWQGSQDGEEWEDIEEPEGLVESMPEHVKGFVVAPGERSMEEMRRLAE